MRCHLFRVLAIAGIVVAGPTSGSAEMTRLLLTDPIALPGSLSLGLSSFHGDGYWDADRTRGSQSNSLHESRLTVQGATDLNAGLFVGVKVPLVHRSLDQAAPGSLDATDFGIGDVTMSFGWRTVTDVNGFQPGLELRWKTPSGRSTLSIEEVNRGTPAAVPLGTGGHEIDLWAATTWQRDWARIAVAGGYRKRLPTTGFFLSNNDVTSETRPRERLVAHIGLSAELIDQLFLAFEYETFKEILLLDSRRSRLGQNQVWGSFAAVALERAFDRGRIRVGWEFPVIGKLYPPPPVSVIDQQSQFQEHDPLLGNRLQVDWTWDLTTLPARPEVSP